MTDLTNADVLRVLQDETKAAVAQSIAPNLPIEFIGVTFIPPDDMKYVECVFIPNNQDNYWGDETLFQGIFRLVLNWPKNNQGAYDPFDVIGSIASHFKKTTPLHGATISLQIYQKPVVGGMLPEESANLFPATMSYRSYQPE